MMYVFAKGQWETRKKKGFESPFGGVLEMIL